MRRLLLFFWLTLAALPLSAQVYNVTRYSTDAGLVQSQVEAIMQDRMGYLWLGTHRGVARFDGVSFSSKLNDTLTGNFFNDLIQDREGNIWMATDGGLNRYDKQHVRKYTVSDSLGLLDNDLSCLLQDRAGTLWIGTRARGLARLVADSFEYVALPWRKPQVDKKNYTVYDLMEDQAGRLWVASNDGLYFRDLDGSFRRFDVPGLPTGIEIFSLLETRDHLLWLGTAKGPFRYDGLAIEALGSQVPLEEQKTILCMVEDKDGQVWLGTQQGILRYEAEKGFQELERNDRSLDYIMRSALVDDEGNIWFGTDGGGMRKITKGIFKTYNMQAGMSSNLAKSFLEDQQGRIWVSTMDRGISLIDQGEQVTETEFRSQKGQNSLGSDRIVYSFEDSRGDFWFASYDGNLTRYDGRFKVFARAEGLSCEAVYCVTEAPDGQIWAGTSNGIFRLESNDRFSRYLYKENGLIENKVFTIEHDRYGRVWVGTSDGISLIEGDRIHAFKLKDTVDGNVITILEGPEGRIWAGSSAGLALFEPGSLHPVKVSISATPGAHTVVGLLLEKERFLWVATENGAYRLDLHGFSAEAERHAFDHYAQEDGLPSLECNANAIFEDSQGRIWIGTIEGAIMRPADLPEPKPEQPPRVYITSVRSSKEAPWEAQGFETNRWGLPLDLKLDHTENRVDFEFIGISLKSPEQVEYRYMLEGLDKNWQRITKQPSIFYPNLSPGSYTFKVQATRESNNWQDSETASFSFEITPPFWQTWWFVSLASLALLGFGAVIYRSLTARRRRINEEKSIRHTAERLRLEHQALYAMMNPHFTFNALQSIQFFIHRQDKKAANKFLSSFAKLVRKNLESTKSEYITLGEEIERLKLYLSLEKMRFPEKFDYQVQTDPQIDLTETQLPPMLLQPFVENSIKHGIMPLEKDGEIVIAIEAEDEDHLRIFIRDNGIGVSASRERRADRLSDHVSKGMQITRDRLALFARMTGKRYQLDIRELTNEAGEVGGTEVSMLLPLKQFG